MTRTLCGILAAVALAAAVPVAADDLPPPAPWLGQVRRGADGQLIVVPAPPSSPAVVQEDAPPRRVLRVGRGEALGTVAQAARAAQDGDLVEILPGDYTRDVAVWTQNDLVIRGVGERPLLLANGASAEGKAIWVIRGGRIRIENIVFMGARVPDRNGAGIRFERGDLTLRRCRFTDNENGLLAGSFDGTLTIEDSEFDHNGDGSGQSHNLYVGAISRLSVTGSYFHHAVVGHLLKSRARENHIFYNRLTDEPGGRASYELEFPNGGVNYVVGNIIEQSATSENGAIIAMGAEGYKGAPAELHLVNNTVVDNRPYGGRPLVVKPGARVRAYDNLVLARQPLTTGVEGDFIHNPQVTADTFEAAHAFDFRIRLDSPLQRSFIAPGSINGVALAPTQEYVHPAHRRPLAGMPTLPGARQSALPDD